MQSIAARSSPAGLGAGLVARRSIHRPLDHAGGLSEGVYGERASHMQNLHTSAPSVGMLVSLGRRTER